MKERCWQQIKSDPSYLNIKKESSLHVQRSQWHTVAGRILRKNPLWRCPTMTQPLPTFIFFYRLSPAFNTIHNTCKDSTQWRWTQYRTQCDHKVHNFAHTIRHTRLKQREYSASDFKSDKTSFYRECRAEKTLLEPIKVSLIAAALHPPSSPFYPPLSPLLRYKPGKYLTLIWSKSW